MEYVVLAIIHILHTIRHRYSDTENLNVKSGTDVFIAGTYNYHTKFFFRLLSLWFVILFVGSCISLN